MPCAEVLPVLILGLALPPSITLHILYSSSSVCPESHDKREADIVEKGVSRKMRMATTLDMQYGISSRYLEVIGGFGDWRRIQRDRETDF